MDGEISPFPDKFRALIELREDQVPIPDYVWLSYAVCAVEEDSCGWGRMDYRIGVEDHQRKG
jgi:hypothetical protein